MGAEVISPEDLELVERWYEAGVLYHRVPNLGRAVIVSPCSDGRYTLDVVDRVRSMLTGLRPLFHNLPWHCGPSRVLRECPGNPGRDHRFTQAELCMAVEALRGMGATDICWVPISHGPCGWAYKHKIALAQLAALHFRAIDTVQGMGLELTIESFMHLERPTPSGADPRLEMPCISRECWEDWRRENSYRQHQAA